MTLRELITRIGFTVDERGLSIYDKAIGRIFEKTDKLYNNLARAADGLTNIGKKASLFLSAPIAGIATVSVMAETKLEDLKNKWGVLIGDMDKGASFVDQIFKEKLQFPQEQIEQYAAELQRLRVPIDQILPKLRQYADINARTGASMEDLIGLQQSVNMGYVNPRLLRQLVGRGLLPRSELAKIFGTSDVQTLMKLANKPGGVRPESIMRLIDVLAARSAGSAEVRTRTLKKAFDELGDSVFRLRAKVGEILARNVGLQKILERLAGWIDKITESIDKLSPGMQKFIVIVGGIAFAIGPTLVGLGTLLKTFIGLQLAVAASKLAGIGFIGMVGKLGGAVGALLLRIGPILLALTAAYLIIQDIYMYIKYGAKASLFGSMYEKIKDNPLIKDSLQPWIFDVVENFEKEWTKVREWWDKLWNEPWKSLLDFKSILAMEGPYSIFSPDNPFVAMANPTAALARFATGQMTKPSEKVVAAGISVGQMVVNVSSAAGASAKTLGQDIYKELVKQFNNLKK